MIVKSVKQGLARTAARAQRPLETGDLFVLAGLVTREGPVMTLVTSVHLAFAMRGGVKISAMMVLDASVLLVTLGRDVRKVCC